MPSKKLNSAKKSVQNTKNESNEDWKKMPKRKRGSKLQPRGRSKGNRKSGRKLLSRRRMQTVTSRSLQNLKRRSRRRLLKSTRKRVMLQSMRSRRDPKLWSISKKTRLKFLMSSQNLKSRMTTTQTKKLLEIRVMEKIPNSFVKSLSLKNVTENQSSYRKKSEKRRKRGS